MQENGGALDAGEALVRDVRAIIDDGMSAAAASVDQCALMTYWRVGRRIAEEVKKGAERAEYGARVIVELADRLRFSYRGHYSKRNLDYFCQFYRLFPDFEIVNARVHNSSPHGISSVRQLPNPVRKWQGRHPVPTAAPAGRPPYRFGSGLTIADRCLLMSLVRGIS